MSTQAGVSTIEFAARPDTGDRRVSLSPDGKLLVLLLAVTLLGPYLPLFRWLGLSEWTTREVRADHLLLPALAAYIGLRAVVSGRWRVPLPLALYAVFCAWLVVTTLFWMGRVPAAYGGNPGAMTLVKGADAYLRPMLMLFIAANVRVSRHDLMVIVRLVFIVGIILALVAAAQLIPFTAEHMNPFLASRYDNAGSEEYFWAVMKGGRVAALMPQLSTLGMYMVLVLGLLGAQLLRARLVEPRFALSLAVGAAALVGGILSGSKVFFAGLALAAALGVFSWPWARRWRWTFRAAGLVLAAGMIMWVVVEAFYPTQAEMFLGRLPVSKEGYYGRYVAPRFEPGSGKVYRTGAVDIALDYPLTGLGLNVVGRTTDSLLLGVLAMSGGVGGVLYLGAMCAVVARLYVVSRTNRDPDLASLARVMAIISVVFLVTAIGFHTLIQDRAGDAYWLIAGLLLGPLAAHGRRPAEGRGAA